MRGYNGGMSVFDSLFPSRHRWSPAETVDIEMHGAGYAYEDGAVGCAPTDLRIAHDGGNVAVIGLNGAGKSTLIRMLGARTSTATCVHSRRAMAGRSSNRRSVM